MEYVTRLADNAPDYPLPLSGRADWQKDDATGCWQTELRLPVVPPEHIIVPSFATLDADVEPYQFEIDQAQQAHVLHPVPATQAADTDAASEAGQASGGDISSHIDCWHTHAEIDQPIVRLTLHGHARPHSYLLTVCVRPLQLDPVPQPVPAPEPLQVVVPCAISQMNAEADIAARICSPTALAMALSALHTQVDWQAAVQACYDPLTRAYGAWPLAIRHAGRYGTLAAVECFSHWRDVAAVLEKGSPLVASIRFGKDELRNAPLAQTAGHLVVLHGLDGDHVLVRDPAARSDAEVARRYCAAQFSAAWLHRRGAAYIFSVPRQA